MTLAECMAFLLEIGRGSTFTDDLADQMARQLRTCYPAEKVYIAPLSSQRGEQIVDLARRMPTGVVRERLGVSRQLISYHMKKAKIPAP